MRSDGCGTTPCPPTALDALDGMAPQVDWVEAMAALDECDAYVVVIADPQTGEVDAQGPLDGAEALLLVEDLRASFDAEELTDVVIRISRLHTRRPAPH